MNSWKFNSVANYFLKFAIAEALEIKPSEVYKVVKEIKATTIHLKDGRILKLNQKEETPLCTPDNCRHGY
jgi:hypothetical protein